MTPPKRCKGEVRRDGPTFSNPWAARCSCGRTLDSNDQATAFAWAFYHVAYARLRA